MKLRALASVLVLSLVTACGAALADLRRAEESYDQARYEAALEWLQGIDRDVPSFARGDRARYYYTRGMTEYRLDHRSEALYWLAMARQFAGEDAEGLRGEQADILARTYAELRPTGPMTHLPPEPGAAPAGDGAAPEDASADEAAEATEAAE